MTDASPTYDHEVFGRLKLKLGAWTGQIKLPSFSILDLPYPKGEYPLEIYPKEPDEVPSDQLFEFLSNFASRDSEFVSKILNALWKDLHGEGPDSGHWWHGAIPDGSIPIFSCVPPQTPEDLAVHVQLYGVQCGVAFTCNPISEPLIQLALAGTWEEEHGLGILLNHEDVIGIGQRDYVESFDQILEPGPDLKINPFTGEPLNP